MITKEDGSATIATWSPASTYPQLLIALLGWGIGLALLTPAVVAAAITAAPADRSGLASGVNNTARQAGGAIGIAAYGAMVGPPTDAHGFVTGLHVTGLGTAALWTLCALASAAALPRRHAAKRSAEPARKDGRPGTYTVSKT